MPGSWRKPKRPAPSRNKRRVTTVKESAFYQALDDYAKDYKALGEMTSGQDGGFLAPEIWTNV
jgi:hypothetical protein